MVEVLSTFRWPGKDPPPLRGPAGESGAPSSPPRTQLSSVQPAQRRILQSLISLPRAAQASTGAATRPTPRSLVCLRRAQTGLRQKKGSQRKKRAGQQPVKLVTELSDFTQPSIGQQTRRWRLTSREAKRPVGVSS